jgi:nicotinamide mononucleotide transporter
MNVGRHTLEAEDALTGTPRAGSIVRPTRAFRVIEVLAVLFTIACVWLTAEEHIACWPVGIVGCLLYGYVFYHTRLYSDVLLQLYFLVTSIYGWYAWGHGGSGDTALPISRLGLGAGALWLGVIAAGSYLLGRWMKRRTRAALPYWDAVTTVMSLVAQYLLAGKVLENWVIWIAADVIDTGVYFARRLYLTSLLYALLLCLAIKGLIEWLAK